MKTFKQFREETQQLDEIAPLALIPAALKLGGAALTAYSAGSALNNLRKGKFKQAAFDAIGALPGGKVFKGIRALGGAKKLAKAGYYYWKKGSDFVKYAEEMIEKNIRVNNEFYVCPVFNQAIKDKKEIRTFDIQKMWGLGTPEDLKYYLENYKSEEL